MVLSTTLHRNDYGFLQVSIAIHSSIFVIFGTHSTTISNILRLACLITLHFSKPKHQPSQISPFETQKLGWKLESGPARSLNRAVTITRLSKGGCFI